MGSDQRPNLYYLRYIEFGATRWLVNGQTLAMTLDNLLPSALTGQWLHEEFPDVRGVFCFGTDDPNLFYLGLDCEEERLYPIKTDEPRDPDDYTPSVRGIQAETRAERQRDIQALFYPHEEVT